MPKYARLRVAGFVNISAGAGLSFSRAICFPLIANYASLMYIYYETLHK